MEAYLVIGIVLFVGSLFVGAGLLTSWLVAPKGEKSLLKSQPYECGEETIGASKIQFKIGYYLFALLFLIFDVEAIFLFPAVVLFRDKGIGAIPFIYLFVELIVFLVILSLGLLYAWKKNLLKWE